MRSIVKGWLLVALGLCLAAPSEAGRGGTKEKLKCLSVTLRLNDKYFCPGGKMANGEDDSLNVKVALKSTIDRPLRFGASERARGRVACYRVNKSGRGPRLQRVGRVFSYRVAGRFGRRDKVVLNRRFPVPKKPGEYVIRTRLSDTTVDSTRFHVCYDKRACPDPKTKPPTPRPPPRPLPPPPPPKPPEPPKPPGDAMAKCLAVTLNVSWFCNDQDDIARVTVRNTHDKAIIPVDGISASGLNGLGGFARESGDGPLKPGETAVFHACGKIPNGNRLGKVWVSNLPGATDSSPLSVNCGPDYSDLMNN